jgi:hypothetical protein
MRSFGNHKIARLAGFACFSGLILPLLGEVRPLESFPLSDRIWMGLEEGSVRPAAYEQVRASVEGELALHAKDGQMLQKDEKWATYDPEALDIERRALTVDEGKLELLTSKNRADAEDAGLRMSLELHEATGKRAELVDVLQDSEVEEAFKKRVKEAIGKMDQKIVLLKERLDPEKVERDLRLETEEGELQVVRKRKQLLAMEKRSYLVAGFAGELRLSDSIQKKLAAVKSPEELLWVKPNELLATIVNDQVYEISVTASSPSLAEIPSEELLVLLQEGRTGRLIAGEYSRTDEIDTGAEIMRTYLFTIQKDSLDAARHSMGQRNLVHVYRKFSQPYRLVFKKDIALLASDVLSASGWDGLVKHLWPGSEVMQVGPQTIAVKPKDEN